MQDRVKQEADIDCNLNRQRILFFHNTLPEYRIGWFIELDKQADIDFIFTNEKLNEKDYGFKIEYDKIKKLNCTFLTDGRCGFKELKKLMRMVKRYDFVELPPIDSLREAIYSAYIVRVCKKAGVRTGYFWEKWEAPVCYQPLERRIKNLILRIIPRAIYKHVDLIFSVGRKNREYFLSNGIDEKRICWIPDVSETPDCEFIDIREIYNIPKTSTLILYLGRLMPQKGVTKLIESFAQLDRDIQYRSFLLIAGDGDDLKECRSLAQKLDVKNIAFAGAVNPAERGNYFEQCDIFVYPVTYYMGWVDVWGLTINEAVQHGKAVIATDAVGSAYELIEDGVNGYRVEPGNVEQLRDAIKKVMKLGITESVRKKDEELINCYCFENMAETFINHIAKISKRRDEWQKY